MEDLPLYDNDFVVVKFNKHDYLYVKNLIDERIRRNIAAREITRKKKGLPLDAPVQKKYQPLAPQVVEIIHDHGFFEGKNIMNLKENSSIQISSH